MFVQRKSPKGLGLRVSWSAMSLLGSLGVSRMLAGRRALLKRSLWRRDLSLSALQHGVSHTGVLVAAVRAREKRLFHDPYAHLLCGKEGDKLLDDVLARAKGNFMMSTERIQEVFALSVAIRHRFYDDFVLRSLEAMRKAYPDDKPVQFVNMAAGLDSRAYRLPWPSNVSVFEVDREEVVEFKRERLSSSGARPLCRHHASVAADVVTDDWEDALQTKGFDPTRPTVFLTEGLLGYLPADEVSRLWTRMHALSCPHSHYGGDWTTTDLFTSPLTTRLLDKLKDMKAPLISGCDKPENLLKETGWDRPDVVALGEERASYGLWPYKPKPRWWPSLLPRVWFITASTTSAKKARQ